MASTESHEHDTAQNVKDAMHQGMGAIEQSVLAAAEIPLSVLSSLGVSEEALKTVREGTEALTSGIRAALSTVADGVTDVTAGVATGITSGVAGAATAAGEAASKVAGARS